MNLFLVQYFLPALLGYTLYVGIADRLSLRRPESRKHRPCWLLGAGVGMTTSAVLATLLTLGTGLTLNAVQALLAPAGLTLAGLFTCVLIATSVYRRALDTGQFLAQATTDAAADPVEHDAENDRSVAQQFAVAPDENPCSALTTTLEWAVPVTSDEHDVAEGAAIRDTHHDDIAIVVSDDNAAQLFAERTLREETEQHLRITRKALFVLENEAQQVERRDGEVLTLETRLADGVRNTAAAEARAERESFARIASETTVSEQREDLLRAQRNLRRNVEARARALAAANKALAHAKQSTRSRRRLVLELEDARATIANRQETISSLIRALEKEKRRTGEEVASLAKQLVLHERQLKARRSLEEVARSVEGKLTTRLVKKVAKARPFVDAG